MLDVFGSAAWMAHGYCLLWTPWLVALHAIPDLFIFLSYTAIPLALLRVLKARADIAEYRALVVLFASFILFCGVTHLMGLVTLWYPVYVVQGALKATTAAVSVTTAIVLFRLVPSLIAIPSPAELAMVNDRLLAEIQNHERTLAELRKAQAELEDKVAERTAELETSNSRLRVLMRETVHRSKNLLTVVQSIARQTARKAENQEMFLDAFMGRLNAMAKATDMVVAEGENTTGEADLRVVVDDQLAHYLESYPERFEIDGSAVGLRTEAAQQMGLILHELATNAVKYGALGAEDGRVAVSWREEGETFRFNWRESQKGKPVSLGRSGGFGTGLLTRAIPTQLGGEAHFDVEDTGAVYTLTVPRENLRPADRTTLMATTDAAYA